MDQLIITESGKKLVHTIIGIRAGWRHERLGKRGITHFLEHAMFLGNDRHLAPDNEAAEYGVSLGGMSLPECTLFHFTSRKEAFARVLPTLLSLIYHPAFNHDRLEREKDEKIITAVNQEADFTPWELAQEWAKNILFSRDFMLSLGTEEELKSVTRGDLRDWHRKYYHSKNSFVVVHGDVPGDEVTRLIEGAEITGTGQIPEPTQIYWDAKEVFVKREGMRRAEMVYGFRIPEYKPEWEILSVILGNYPLSKLWKDEFSTFTYTVGSRLEWTPSCGGLFLYFGANSMEDTAIIDRNLWSLLEDLRIDENELKFATETRLLDIWKMKEGGEQGLLRFVACNPDLRYRSFDAMAKGVDRLDKTGVVALSELLLNKDNMVRAIVAGES